MASTNDEAPAFEPEAFYRARVSQPVSVGPFKYLPRNDLKRVTGETLNAIAKEYGADAIASADKI